MCIQGALFRLRRYGVFLLPEAFRKNIFIVPGIGNYAVRKVNFNPLKAVERRRNKGYCSVFVRITRFIVRNRAELIVFFFGKIFYGKAAAVCRAYCRKSLLLIFVMPGYINYISAEILS